jgi:cell division transport system permease protein
MRLFGQRNEIPLGGDEASRFVPWIVGSMVFLAALALAGTLAIAMASSRWDAELAGTATVQVAPPPDQVSADVIEARVQSAVAVLRATPGVLKAEPLADTAAQKLLAPWLGDASLNDLPVPRLIDVTIEPAELNPVTLQQRLSAAAPGAVFDDHRQWVGGLRALAHALELVAVAILGLVGSVAVIAIIFATRSGMAVNREVVEVLHLIGARDDYIANGFARHASVMALRGGVGGALLATGALLVLQSSGASLANGLLPSFTIGIASWALIAALPVCSAVLAALTARVTVMASLAGMA